MPAAPTPMGMNRTQQTIQLHFTYMVSLLLFMAFEKFASFAAPHFWRPKWGGLSRNFNSYVAIQILRAVVVRLPWSGTQTTGLGKGPFANFSLLPFRRRALNRSRNFWAMRADDDDKVV
jgi:hypothetical protein